MDHCCNKKADEIAALGQGARRRVLLVVLAINVAMFFTEFGAGVIARSTALMADSVDMLGDAIVYVLSLYALARGARWKAGAALVKGGIILVFGVWVIIEIVLKLLHGVTPTSSLMAIFGGVALAANVTCMLMLWRHRDEDINMSSTFECSRNDVIANIGVLIAAAGVWQTEQAWPDIAAGSIVAALFLRSAIRVIREAWPQFRAAKHGSAPAAPTGIRA
jgi:cation diffusion facilitator family transporter